MYLLASGPRKSEAQLPGKRESAPPFKEQEQSGVGEARVERGLVGGAPGRQGNLQSLHCERKNNVLQRFRR